MSKNVCECGLDCHSIMALDKHMAKCPVLNKFTNRFKVKARCPVCSMYERSFYRKDEETLVCLDCGVHFTNGLELLELKAECGRVSWRR